MFKEKLRTLGRRITTRRALVLLCAGALASALLGMFCGLTQRGMLQFFTYEVARWEGVSSKYDWPGPMPKSWNGPMFDAPQHISHKRSLHVGWMHCSSHTFFTLDRETSFSYYVYAWGFPVPSMRHDEARGIGKFPYDNVVESRLLRGYEVTTSARYGSTLLATIPLVPWWPGFILNTLLWFLFLAWITRTFQRVRWFKRMQKGQCIKCKYQVGSLHQCPECGTEKPIQ